GMIERVSVASDLMKLQSVSTERQKLRVAGMKNTPVLDFAFPDINLRAKLTIDQEIAFGGKRPDRLLIRQQSVQARNRCLKHKIAFDAGRYFRHLIERATDDHHAGSSRCDLRGNRSVAMGMIPIGPCRV